MNFQGFGFRFLKQALCSIAGISLLCYNLINKEVILSGGIQRYLIGSHFPDQMATMLNHIKKQWFTMHCEN